MRGIPRIDEGIHTTTPESNKGHQGPDFPYRFSFETSYLRRHAPQMGRWEVFCRWSTGHCTRPKALEWCDHGKGKGVTALSSDEPMRCCSDCTPFMVLTRRIDEVTRMLAPGAVYIGTITGHGWYSAPPGTEFLIRLVTNPEDVDLLRAEASIYELYEASWANSSESGASKSKTFIPPLEFHGFFQNGTGTAAAIVLKATDKKSKKYVII
ncbi:hypothetical protein Clacol_000380 [Clathrus columnatus]|uniref:Uncharacterized protein n=1 Tax=Clathrus columnatus TaxID=1419009 RepID=A0AAV4ZZJ4_9AGAM|nr:hypothetical protein Clacol_000380 [Clathrus columnatus]